MITKKTVFVLGAGASSPYNFPTASDLSELLYHELQKPQSGWNSLTANNLFNGDQIEDFRTQFWYSGKNSVDTFLEHRSEFLEIGKAAIAQQLIRHESTGMLFKRHENWYRHLYSRLNATPENFLENGISFITFNYDRSLEQFLFTALKYSYRLSDSECADIVEQIPIIHLHGRLGYLPWQQAEPVRQYTASVNTEDLKICMQSIKIVHEDISSGRDEDFSVAKTLLHNAERVYILGFGYDPINVQRLGLDDLRVRCAAGTCFGLGGAEQSQIKQMTRGRIGLVDSDCLAFLKSHADLD